MSAVDRQREQLVEQLRPVVAGLGFDLEDIAVNRVGRRHLVRVTVDGDDGIDLDGIALVSRAAERSLDADDPFGSPFVLEVTSPGVERPLREPRHWRRNMGRLVRVDIDGRPVTARIVGVDDVGVQLQSESGSTGVAWDRVGPGVVQVEFNRAESGRAEPGRAEPGRAEPGRAEPGRLPSGWVGRSVAVDEAGN